MTKAFNLNYSMGVKLTYLGWQRYKEYVEAGLASHFIRPIHAYQREMDNQGYLWIQGWRLLEAFGGEYSKDAAKYYSMTILFNANELI